MEILNLSDSISSDVCINLAEEYVSGDKVYCKKCNGVRWTKHEGKYYKGLCDCQKAEMDAEEKRKRIEAKYRSLEEMKSMCLLGKKYQTATFENTDIISPEFEKIYNRLMKYCQEPKKRLELGQGFYIYGEAPGTGKSHLTACVGNELLKNEFTVMFTNFIEISNQIQNSYAKRGIMSELDIVNKIASYDFLVIDDFGTEQFKKASDDTLYQQRVFDILNKRYNKMLPTIFSSNMSIKQLVEDCGVWKKTVDRVMEMSRVVFHLEGESYRKKIRKDVDF